MMDPKSLVNWIKIGIFASLLTPFLVGNDFLGKGNDFYFPFVGLKSLYFMAVIEAVFFLWAVLAWKWRQYRPDLKNPVIAAVLIFLAVSFVSAVFGADFSNSFWSKFERMDGILMLCHLAAFFVVIATVFKVGDWRWFFRTSIAAAVVIAVEALFDRSPAAAAGGLIGNDSFWGTYLLFNIFFALYLFFLERWSDSKTSKIFAAAAFLVLAAALLMEGSQSWAFATGVLPALPQRNFFIDIFDSGARAAKISTVFGLFIAGIICLAVAKNLKVKLLGRGILAVLVVGILSVIVLSVSPGNWVNKAMEKGFGEGTIHGRIVVWQIAWKGFLDRPILGWGSENFGLAFVKYYNPCLGSSQCAPEVWFDRAHNIVFDTLAETGVFGLLAYLSIFAAAFYALCKIRFWSKAGTAETAIFTSLLLAYFLQNLTVFDMVVSYTMWFAVLGFIASLYSSRRDVEKIRPLPLGLKPWFVAGVIFVICFCAFATGPLATDHGVAEAVMEPYGSPQRLQMYEQTLASSPMGKYQIRIFFAQQWLAAISDKNVAAELSKEHIEGEFSYIAGELEKSRKESGLDFQSRLELGRVYNAWAVFDRSKISLAEEVLKEALLLSPRNQQAYWELAQTMVDQGRINDALLLAQQAYDLYPQNAQAKTVVNEIEGLQAQEGKAAE
jgi:O-antigen ligase